MWRRGAPHNWLIDPWRRKAYVYRTGSLEQVAERLQTEEPEITLSLEEVFHDL